VILNIENSRNETCVPGKKKLPIEQRAISKVLSFNRKKGCIIWKLKSQMDERWEQMEG